jgi:protocatechuate 3,4-dioxygenase alpha subunit
MSLQTTTWQTVGPFFSIGLDHLNTVQIASTSTPGERLMIAGRVIDGKGDPVPDAVIEIWQANAEGQFVTDTALEPTLPTFTGFGRIPTDGEGRFRFTTVRPGPVPGPNGTFQSPHLAVRIMMRGILRDLVTRMYFPCETIGSDPILQLVPEQRRQTLIAVPVPEKEGTFEWKIELQGARETVFFDC